MSATPSASRTRSVPWPEALGRDRLAALDLARFVAIVGMMGAHTMPIGPGAGLVGAAVDGPPSTLFAITGGASVVLAGRSRLSAGDRVGAMRATAARGLAVALLGMLLAPLAPAVFVVLVPFGAAITLAAFLVAAPTWSLALAASPLVLFSGWASALARADTLMAPTSIGLPSFLSDPVAAMRETLLTGVYPVTTWLGYLIIGMLVARVWLQARASGSELRMLTIMSATGAALVAAAWASTAIGLLLVSASYPSIEVARSALIVNGYGAAASGDLVMQLIAAPHTGTPADIARTTGLSLCAIGLIGLTLTALHRLGTGAMQVTVCRILAPARAAGTAPLTLYVVHVILFSVLVAAAPSAGALDFPARGPAAWALHVAIGLLLGVLLALLHSRGPLESVVSRIAHLAAQGRNRAETAYDERRRSDEGDGADGDR